MALALTTDDFARLAMGDAPRLPALMKKRDLVKLWRKAQADRINLAARLDPGDLCNIAVLVGEAKVYAECAGALDTAS